MKFKQYLNEKLGKVGKNLSMTKGVTVITKKGGAPYTFLTTKNLTDKEIKIWVKKKLDKLGDKTEIISIKPF